MRSLLLLATPLVASAFIGSTPSSSLRPLGHAATGPLTGAARSRGGAPLVPLASVKCSAGDKSEARNSHAPVNPVQQACMPSFSIEGTNRRRPLSLVPGPESSERMMTMRRRPSSLVTPAKRCRRHLQHRRGDAWHVAQSMSDETHAAQGYLKTAITTGLSVLLLATSVGTANVMAADAPAKGRDEGLSGEQLFFKRCTECHAGERISLCLSIALSMCASAHKTKFLSLDFDFSLPSSHDAPVAKERSRPLSTAHLTAPMQMAATGMSRPRLSCRLMCPQRTAHPGQVFIEIFTSRGCRVERVFLSQGQRLTQQPRNAPVRSREE